jgi:glycosyltransferase involved in cell wall biosynthesis
MLRLTVQRLKRPVICVPFAPENIQAQGGNLNKYEKQFDFIYVASGEAHKNHKALINAWGILADEGLFPSLALTLVPEQAPELCALAAKEMVSRGARIHTIGFVSHERVMSMYRESGALIYPSIFESFGLPLIEAQQVGLPVLAPELDYVRDVIEPDETFDPRSPISIARAVRRHLKGRKADLEIFTAKKLLELVHPGSNS